MSCSIVDTVIKFVQSVRMSQELVAPDGRIKSLMFTFAYKVIGHMITGLD